MDITPFDSFDDAMERLRRDREAADTRVQPWQTRIKSGDYFRRSDWYGFNNYGEVLSEEEPPLHNIPDTSQIAPANLHHMTKQRHAVLETLKRRYVLANDMETTVYGRDLALYYDSIYAHKDYRKEVSFIAAMTKKYGIKGKRLLDVGCGTGNHASLLVKRGYDVVGIDQSSDVLSIATKKVPGASFKRAKMGTLNQRRRFDVILCLFSVINYNTNRRELFRTFRNFREHLQGNGIVICDFPMKGESAISAEFFLKNKGVILQDILNKHKKTVVTTYVIVGNNNDARVIKEVHEVRTHTLDEIAWATKTAGLDCQVYWDFSLGKTNGLRPVLVCRRA